MITPAGVCEKEPIESKVRNGDQAKMVETKVAVAEGKNLLSGLDCGVREKKIQHRCRLLH